MKYIYLLLGLTLLACATGKNKQNTAMQNLTVNVDIIKNQMPTTDGSNNNYAIVKLHAGGDTLQDDWSLAEFTLMDEDEAILHQIDGQKIEDSDVHASALGKNINVRNLPGDIPSTVLVRVDFVSTSGDEFSYKTDPIRPKVVQ
ncbi:MAG: hypothetical protein ACQERC_07890 [Bacteroidota bacterium]